MYYLGTWTLRLQLPFSWCPVLMGLGATKVLGSLRLKSFLQDFFMVEMWAKSRGPRQLYMGGICNMTYWASLYREPDELHNLQTSGARKNKLMPLHSPVSHKFPVDKVLVHCFLHEIGSLNTGFDKLYTPDPQLYNNPTSLWNLHTRAHSLSRFPPLSPPY